MTIISAMLSINIASVSACGIELSSIPSVGRSVCLLVCVSVRKMYCGKMDDWIQMPFGMVSGVGRGMRILDGMVIVIWEGAVLGVNLGRLVVINGDFVA